MEIKITEQAFKWFQQEMDVEKGDYIRFYARYGGSSPFHEGFSLGMNRETPHELAIETVKNAIHFYIEQADLWFFNEHDLIVSVNEAQDELHYSYEKSAEH